MLVIVIFVVKVNEMSVQESICFIFCETIEEGTVVSVKKRGIETLINVV